MVTTDANRTASSHGGRKIDIPTQGCPGDGDYVTVVGHSQGVKAFQ